SFRRAQSEALDRAATWLERIGLDFGELVTQAKSRGIRIILDMVFNHTSTQHAWFREALNKESPYRQFYIWPAHKGHLDLVVLMMQLGKQQINSIW
ncbi:alpha-amylase family glycosyl hydrolase, partial [Escherichia coli]|nr:alpha-amylase family glycosyl hydrolase [Escherichia coli]